VESGKERKKIEGRTLFGSGWQAGEKYRNAAAVLNLSTRLKNHGMKGHRGETKKMQRGENRRMIERGMNLRGQGSRQLIDGGQPSKEKAKVKEKMRPVSGTGDVERRLGTNQSIRNKRGKREDRVET